jgi:hypothetical protein
VPGPSSQPISDSARRKDAEAHHFAGCATVAGPRLTPRRIAPSDRLVANTSRGTQHAPLAVVYPSPETLGVCSHAPARAVAGVVVRVAATRHAPSSPTDSDGSSRGRARAAATVNKQLAGRGRSSWTRQRDLKSEHDHLAEYAPRAAAWPRGAYTEMPLSPGNSGGIREPMLIRSIHRAAPVSSGRGDRNGTALSAGAGSARRAKVHQCCFPVDRAAAQEGASTTPPRLAVDEIRSDGPRTPLLYTCVRFSFGSWSPCPSGWPENS